MPQYPKGTRVDEDGNPIYPSGTRVDDNGNVMGGESASAEESATSRAASGFWKNANPMTALSALGSAVTTDPRKTGAAMYENQMRPWDRAGVSAQKGDYVQAAMHGVTGMIPLIGPSLDDAYQKTLEGDYAGGLGEYAGMLVPGEALRYAKPAMVKGLRPIAQKTSDAIYERAFKPLTSIVDKPGNEGINATRQLIENGVILSKRGLQKQQGITNRLRAKDRQLVADAEGGGAQVDMGRAASDATDYMMNKSVYGSQLDSAPALDQAVNKIASIEASYPQKIGIRRADNAREATNVVHRKDYGKLSGPAVEAEKAVNNSIVAQEYGSVPGLEDVRKSRASNIVSQKALGRAVRRIGNQNVIGMNDLPLVASLGASAANPSFLPAAAASAAYSVLRRPAVQSGIAIGIDRIPGALDALPYNDAMRLALVAALADKGQK